MIFRPIDQKMKRGKRCDSPYSKNSTLYHYVCTYLNHFLSTDVLTNNTNDIVVAAQQSTRQLNNAQNGITLKVYSHGISQVQNSLAIYGMNILVLTALVIKLWKRIIYFPSYESFFKKCNLKI